MKIYQIHEYGGQWEDSYDYIVSSYLSEDKAKIEKERLELEEKEREKCQSCPLYFCTDDCDSDCTDCKEPSIEKIKKYCSKYETFDKSKHNPEEYDMGEKCIHRDLYYESSFYRIEVVDVIE